MKKTTIKILLVDDDPDVIEVLTYNLLKEGYQILTAKDGIEAIKQAKKNSPHLIIMDVMMPNMDGIQACDVLRRDKKFNKKRKTNKMNLIVPRVNFWTSYPSANWRRHGL